MLASEDFRRVAEAAVDDVLRYRPDVATWKGDHRFDDQLPDLSDAGVAAFARVLRQHRAALDEVPLAELTLQDRIDAEILGNNLDRMVFAAEVTRDHEWDLLEHNAADPIFLLMSRDTTPLEQRVAGITARLAALPDFLATARRTVTRAPQVHVETALSQLPGVRNVITTELDRTLAGDSALTSVVTKPRGVALEALEVHQRWLRDLVDSAEGDPRLGADVFARKLSHTLDAAVSAGEVAERARIVLDETSEELYGASRELLDQAVAQLDGLPVAPVHVGADEHVPRGPVLRSQPDLVVVQLLVSGEPFGHVIGL